MEGEPALIQPCHVTAMLDLGYTVASPLTAIQAMCSEPMLFCQPVLTEILLTDVGYNTFSCLFASLRFVVAASS